MFVAQQELLYEADAEGILMNDSESFSTKRETQSAQ